MIMKYALVIADVPKVDFAKSPDGGLVALCNYEDNISSLVISNAGSVRRLGLGVYSIVLGNTLHILTPLLYNAQILKIPLRVLFLDEEPSWLTSK